MEHIIDEGYEDCPCNPTVIPVKHENGSMNYVYAHNYPELSEEMQAGRTAAIFEVLQDMYEND